MESRSPQESGFGISDVIPFLVVAGMLCLEIYGGPKGTLVARAIEYVALVIGMFTMIVIIRKIRTLEAEVRQKIKRLGDKVIGLNLDEVS